MGVIIMARKTVEEITSDLTGVKFYASNDGLTTEPMSVSIDGATPVVLDLAPDEKNAIREFFAGNTEDLYVLLAKLHKGSNSSNGSVDAALKVKVSEWITQTDGKVPGRVTSGMVERYQTYLRAQEIIAAADAANAATDNSDDNTATE